MPPNISLKILFLQTNTNKLKRIDKFILKAYLGPFFLTFFISLFILLMQFLWLYVDDLVGKGLEWHVLLRLLFYASSTFVPMALPLAILLSSLMTFGNLGEHYELVALKASGISLKRIMMPLIIFSIMLSASAFLFSNNVLPYANLKFHSLLYDVKQKKLAFQLKKGIFNTDLGDYSIRIGNKNKDATEIFDVMIYDHSDKRGNTKVTVAERGKVEQLAGGNTIQFTLYNGYNYEEILDKRKQWQTKRPFQTTKFASERVRFSFDNGLKRTDENLFKNSYHMMNLAQLRHSKDSLSRNMESRKQSVYRLINLRQSTYKDYDYQRLHNFLSQNINSTSASFIVPHAQKQKTIEAALREARSLQASLDHIAAELINKEDIIRKHDIALHKKFTLSIACLLLFFVGAPLGAIIRKGGLGLPVVVSTLFFIAYYIIGISGERAVKAGSMDIWAGMWLASAIFLPIGLFLTYKATSDDPLFDKETYNRLISKIIKKKNT